MMRYQTHDGLALEYDAAAGRVSGLQVGGREIGCADIPSGFLAQDVAENTEVFGFKDGTCPKLHLALSAEIVAHTDHLRICGRVTDTSGEDRAVTLTFALPVDLCGGTWHDDVRHARPIQAGEECLNAVDIGTGATGTMSLYPWGAVTASGWGLGLGVDMETPAQYRIGYCGAARRLYIAYDFGLTPETLNFPGSAPFAFVVTRIDPVWGFRSAARRFYDIFPGHFICRSKDQGIWMPFTDIGTVEGWEDFGFKYKEGTNHIGFDNRAGILTFRYTEPSTWWMRMPPEVPRTHEGVMQFFEACLRSDDPAIRRSAQAIQASGSYDAQGRLQYRVRDTPWCNGAVFSSNPSPYLPGDSEARKNWNEDLKRRLYGPDAEGVQAGEYLDSLEGYVTATENCRPDHFRHVTVPLTFSRETRRPVIHKAFSVYEFTRQIASDLHGMGRLLFANSVPHRFAFLCPWIDIMGTEMNWNRDGEWNPAPDAWLNFKRAMCYQKPYLFLMNTPYDRFPPDRVEKYFQRALFYGMYPSMFSHNASQDPYWRAPRWYNRDRPPLKPLASFSTLFLLLRALKPRVTRGIFYSFIYPPGGPGCRFNRLFPGAFRTGNGLFTG